MTTDRPRVLVIEDDPVYAAFARASLKKTDDPPEHVLFAKTLAAGLQQIARNPPSTSSCSTSACPTATASTRSSRCATVRPTRRSSC